jgi:hypothetical protein
MSVKLNKSDVYSRLSFNSVEDMNLAILNLADCLKEQGQEVPEELTNPESFEDVSKEHLTLLRDSIRNALDTPALPESQLLSNGAITSTASQKLAEAGVPTGAPGTLAGFRETLKQLGVQYVAKAAAYDISDSFFLELDKSLAQRNEQNLRSRIDVYRTEFDAALMSINQVVEDRVKWQEETLGKFNGLANFSDLDAKLASIQKK